MASSSTAQLTAKQQQIVEYLDSALESRTYFKSRQIANDLDLSTKEVGANITALIGTVDDLTIERWGYSTSTTWKITHDEC